MKTRKLLTAVIAFLAFAVTTLAQTVPSYVPTNGLVGYWGFNGNANDQSGNGNNGTVNGATLTTDRNGNANSAYSFDGVSNYISTNLNGVLSSNSRSISFWYNSSSNNIDETVFTDYGGNNCGEGFACTLFPQNKPGVDNTCSYIYSNNTTNINTWNFYTVSYSSTNSTNITNCTLYINGVLQSTTPGGALLGINTTNVIKFVIGSSRLFNSVQYFNGKIDDVAIYNRALIQSEITQLYNSNPVQTLCTKTTQPYNVNVGDATHDGSTYAWSIAPATPSAVMTGNGTNAITIDWTNALSGTYTLQAIETSIDGCVSTAVSASINLSGTPTTNTTSLSGCNSVTYKTKIYTISTVVTDTVKSYQGCDSIYNVANITVNPIVTPTFTTVASSCANATLTALPTTSNNGVTGTWSPALNNTTTTTYTFTPNAGQCANTTTQTITITAPKVTSAISFVAPIQNLSVGMSYAGGKIIYIFQPGDAGYVSGQTHGLIIATGSITTTASGINFGPYFSTFGCSGVSIANTSTAMGTGISNTNILAATCGSSTVASFCDLLVENGYSDWFLPSKDELSKVYQNYSLVGGVYPTQSQGVWSSSEVNASSGYVCSFDGGGGWVILPKTYGFAIKPLRKF